VTDAIAQHFEDAAVLVQTQRHQAEIATARCASDNDWDTEAYWRARAEGLADAEKILRGHAEELRNG
jgi:hypothetical protein